MKKITHSIRNWFNGLTTVDPAVALGLFGTGVGLALPIDEAEAAL